MSRSNKQSDARSAAILLLANVLGCIGYVWGARQAWAIPEEAANGIHVVTGEPFVWALSVLPVWTVFFGVNLAWAVAIVIRRRWLDGRIWLVSASVWMVAVVVDFAHH